MPRPNNTLPRPDGAKTVRLEIAPELLPPLRQLAAGVGLSVASLSRVVVELAAAGGVSQKAITAEVARRRKKA